MLQRVVMLAAESLMVLEHQLMDGDQIQDVRVGKSSRLFSTLLSFLCTLHDMHLPVFV